MTNEKNYTIRGLCNDTAIDITVTETELRRIAKIAGIVDAAPDAPVAPSKTPTRLDEFVAHISGNAPLQAVSAERGSGSRDIQGVRLSMGGLRLPRMIVIRDTDEFHVGNSGLIIKPEDLVPLIITSYGRAELREGYGMYPWVTGFKLPRNSFTNAPLLLSSGNVGSIHLLGNVMDAIVEDSYDKSDFAWVVIEPVIIPPPRTFPTGWVAP